MAVTIVVNEQPTELRLSEPVLSSCFCQCRDAAPSSTLLSTQHRGGKRLPPIQHHTGVVSVIPGNSVLTTALDSPRRQEDHSKLSVDTSQQTSVQSVGVQTASIPRVRAQTAVKSLVNVYCCPMCHVTACAQYFVYLRYEELAGPRFACMSLG